MSRPREFNESQVIEKAMQVFWTQGYEASSLKDLTHAMGLSKSSLYDTFGSKHDLFLATIDYYRENVTGKVRSAANLDAPARHVIKAILGRAVDRILAPDGRRGCFLNNTAVEVGMHDPEARARCQSGMAVMEQTMHKLVVRGQSEGDISSTKSARALARFMTSTINGVMVIGKANPDRAVLDDIVEIAVSAMD